jgi:hypothetical protein
MRLSKLIFTVLTVILFLPTFAQTKHTVSGSMRDSKTGEELIGAILSVRELANTGAATNAYGFYSLTLPSGKYTLVGHYVG